MFVREKKKEKKKGGEESAGTEARGGGGKEEGVRARVWSLNRLVVTFPAPSCFFLSSFFISLSPSLLSPFFFLSTTLSFSLSSTICSVVKARLLSFLSRKRGYLSELSRKTEYTRFESEDFSVEHAKKISSLLSSIDPYYCAEQDLRSRSGRRRSCRI